MTPVGFLDTGVIYCGDNLKRLSEFPSDSVDLIYLDPPFFSNRHYEVIWGDEAEVRSFEDRWAGGIEVYVEWMRERVMEIRRVLKETGSVYLHCDWHASHYLKVMMDDVFGQQHFQNEFVWYYSGGGRQSGDGRESTTCCCSTQRATSGPSTLMPSALRTNGQRDNHGRTVPRGTSQKGNSPMTFGSITASCPGRPNASATRRRSRSFS